MDRRQFVQLGLMGSAAGVLVPQVALAAPTGLLSGPFAGGIFYTKEKPGRWAEKAAGHSPVVEVSGKMLMVTTPHEMKGFEHYIVKHTILDAGMTVLAEHLFDPAKDTAPVSQLEIPGYSGVAYALSMCNKHDVWVTEFTI